MVQAKISYIKFSTQFFHTKKKNIPLKKSYMEKDFNSDSNTVSSKL